MLQRFPREHQYVFLLYLQFHRVIFSTGVSEFPSHRHMFDGTLLFRNTGSKSRQILRENGSMKCKI